MTTKNTAFLVTHAAASTAVSKFFQELGADGKRVVFRMKDDPVYLRRLAHYAKECNQIPYVSQNLAQEIMGKFFLGPEAAMQYLGVTYTEEQLATLAVVPKSEDELHACAKDYVLVAGAPQLSILDIRKRCLERSKLFHGSVDTRFDNDRYVKGDTVSCRWYLIRKSAVLDSFDKFWGVQKLMVQTGETVPRACEVVYASMLLYLATGVRLFTDCYVRCATLGEHSGNVYVGKFSDDGQFITFCDSDVKSEIIGLAAERKWPEQYLGMDK